MDARPTAWSRRYRNKGYINTDPLVSTAQQRVTPCTWSEAMAAFADDPAAKLIHNERLAHGVTDGLLVPIHSAKGCKALVSIGTNSALTAEALHELTMKSLVTHNILSSMQQSDPSDPDAFTEREIECLKWVAAGKTDAEIAQILHLSRKTVFWHINGATKRINASSRSHAVASAIRMGLFN
jgi:LuxR family transcriptional regulator, quorum-sensing system regulator BjaR1